MKYIIALVMLVLPLFPAVFMINYSGNGNISGNTNIRPGSTNILVFTFTAANSAGDSNFAGNYFPRTYSIDLKKTGLASQYFKAVHFYYSTSAVFSLATAVEARTNNLSSPWSPYKFQANFSPNNFGADDYCYMGPDLYTYIPNGQTIYYFVTVDMQTNMPDNTTFSLSIPTYSIFNYAGHDFYVAPVATMNQGLTGPPSFQTEVVASNLIFTSVPAVATKTVPFPVKLLAVDTNGNWDKDFTRTAQIYFMLTNVAPTPWAAGMGTVVHHSGNKANYAVGVTNNYNNECTINNAGLYQIIAIDGLTGVTAATSATIVVQPDIHHFEAKDQSGVSLSGYPLRAGQSISNSGIVKLMIYPRDAAGNAYTNYNGRFYFTCDDPKRNFRIPYDGDTNTQPTMTNGTNYNDMYPYIASTSQCTSNIGGSNFYFYNAGTFTFSVVDPTNDIKSDFVLNVLANDPVVMVPTIVDSYKARDPLKILLTLYDQYTNAVTWFNGTFSLAMRKSNDNSVYTNFTVLGSPAFVNGVYQGTSLVGPYVRDPGDYIMTVTLDTNTSITTNFNLRITLNGDETSLALGNNYITPGSAARVVEIFGQNKTRESIDVVVTIYDSTGRRIKEFPPQTLLPGFGALSAWTLKSGRDIQVPAGLYLVNIRAKDVSKISVFPTTTKKVVIVR